MKHPIRTIAFSALCFATIVSCNRAGLDGDATLAVFPKHHGTPIVNHTTYRDTVYVKFNAKDLPSDPTHDYDAIFVGDPGEDHVHCTGFHTGNYYLFVAGFDTTINARVTGGMAVKIKYRERKEEIDLDVPVTE